MARRGERLEFWREYIARQQPGYVKKELSPESEATLQFMEKRRKEHIREGNSQPLKPATKEFFEMAKKAQREAARKRQAPKPPQAWAWALGSDHAKWLKTC